MTHDESTAAIRGRLAQTHAMLAQCDAQDAEITRGATARLKQVASRLEALRPGALLDQAAADEYLELTKEKGALLRTLEGHEQPEALAKSHEPKIRVMKTSTE